ncbi:hypothetical protein Gpo141_00009921 [Globisporangium polare]
MHLLQLRTLAPVASSSRVGGSAISGATRTLKYLVQPSAVCNSSRFPVSTGNGGSSGDGHRQIFEKVWTLSGAKPLEKLKVRLPGVTFISVGDEHDLENDQVAKIRATSDSAEALESISVSSWLPYRTILDFEPSAQTSSHGNLLTEILLPRGATGWLRNVAAKGQGLVIVEDGVLAMHERPDDVIKLAATQGGKITIKSAQDVDVSRLQVAVARRSKVFFQAPALRARDKVEIAGIGGSEVHFQSQNGFETPLLKLAIAGSGNCSVQADEFVVDEVTSAIAGSGRIVLDTGSAAAVGACGSHQIAIFGAGDVDCAGMSTKRAAVAVAGQGSVTLDATDEIKVGAFGEAKVMCLNTPPASINARGFQSPHPVTSMSADDRKVREQRRDVENQELQDFWRSLPSRESALETASQVALTGVLSKWWW